MKVTMNRMNHEVIVGDLTPESEIKLKIGKEELVDAADEEGMAYFKCDKLIPGNLRKEAVFIVGNMEYIFEIRMTKLVPKHIVEVRKEK